MDHLNLKLISFLTDGSENQDKDKLEDMVCYYKYIDCKLFYWESQKDISCQVKVWDLGYRYTHIHHTGCLKKIVRRLIKY